MSGEDEVLAQKTTDELFDEIARRHDGLLMVTRIDRSESDQPVQVRGKGNKVSIMGLASFAQAVFLRDLLSATRDVV